ncbi:hypothetical protein CPB85DRAFT_1345305, partial [Mucidula mucida]
MIDHLACDRNESNMSVTSTVLITVPAGSTCFLDIRRLRQRSTTCDMGSKARIPHL